MTRMKPRDAMRLILGMATAFVLTVVALGVWRHVEPGPPVDSAKALTQLQIIADAERDYHKENGKYATLEQLASKRPYISQGLSEAASRGYTIALVGTPDENSWAARAMPTSGRTSMDKMGFYIDQTGVVRYEAGGATPNSKSPSCDN